jgi:hypothetical protein
MTTFFIESLVYSTKTTLEKDAMAVLFSLALAAMQNEKDSNENKRN